MRPGVGTTILELVPVERLRLAVLLAGYRILDLTNDQGLLCGKLLADLGAEVIAVEPPEGNRARHVGPFLNGDSGPSLYWMAYASGRKGVSLNMASDEGRDLLLRMVAVADAVVESFPPGCLNTLGLDYEAQCAVNPSIVLVSTTPFGQDGPYADYKATDLTINALGGLAYVTGDLDRPPVRVSFPQAFLITAAAAALGAMLALYHRTRTGEGQHVDVSAQQSVALTLDRAPIFWDFARTVLPRTGFYGRLGGSTGSTLRRMVYPCKDGYVSYLLMGGTSGAKSMRAIIEWMDEEGFDSTPVKGIDWQEVDYTSVPQGVLDQTCETLASFFAPMSKEVIWQESQRRRLLLYPVATPGEVYHHARAMQPDYFRPVEHPELGRLISYLGPFVSFAEAPHPVCKAPYIGEHNREVYGGLLGLSEGDLDALEKAGTI